MPANQLAKGTVSFATLLARFRERITSAPVLDESKVRVVAAPNDKLVQYLSESCVLLRVRSPSPYPGSGGGRHDYRVSRVVDVVVATTSLLDPGGTDALAVAAHIAREEAVIDAAHDVPPASAPPTASQLTAVPVTVKWIEGGEDVARQIDHDAAMLVSVLPFRFEYRAPLTVYRD